MNLPLSLCVFFLSFLRHCFLSATFYRSFLYNNNVVGLYITKPPPVSKFFLCYSMPLLGCWVTPLADMYSMQVGRPRRGGSRGGGGGGGGGGGMQLPDQPWTNVMNLLKRGHNNRWNGRQQAS